MEAWVVAGGFGLAALAHSGLGERLLLRPLFAQPWTLPVPRRAAELIFRFAWHMTSLAWLGLASIALGVSVWTAVFAVAAASALIVFVVLRGHLSWPIFTSIAVAAGLAQGWIGTGTLQAASIVSAAALVVVAGLHVYWAGGGRLHLAAAIPSADGKPVFKPPRWLTAAVALALFAAAVVQLGPLVGWTIPGASVVLWVSVVAFGLRTIGDGRFVGFTKSRRDSRFARLDDKLYTPLSFLFTVGGLAAAML